MNVGSKYAIYSVLIGATIAYSIMTFFSYEGNLLKALSWIKEWNYVSNLLVGLFGLLLFGYFFGRLAAKEIIEKNRDHTWVGFKYGILTLWSGTLLGSLVGFFQEGFHKIGMHDDPFVDYIYKPMFWVTFFGLFPVLFVGFWFGRQIKKHSK